MNLLLTRGAHRNRFGRSRRPHYCAGSSRAEQPIDDRAKHRRADKRENSETRVAATPD